MNALPAPSAPRQQNFRTRFAAHAYFVESMTNSAFT
jgi:hypothetical protein